MAIRTFGPNAVDWEQRIDLERLRTDRLTRMKAALEASDLGAVLTFDFANIRYLTATHIGTWAMDKLIRFAVLPRGGEPVLWDFGSAAKHHQLFNPWLDGTERARAGISTLRGAFHPGAGIAEEVARKVATVLPGLSDEKAALQEKLEAVGTQLVQLQKDQDDLQKANADLTQQLAASRQAAEKAQADVAAVQGKAAEAERAAESHNASVAELTAANDKLKREHEDMRRLVDSYRADIARLTQNVRSAEQQRADAERGGQQNIDALTAQMAQLRRDLEAARTAQARLNENFAAQDRDRIATITQLRTENGALAARLNQAQGTLDQIASAARLGTPAATIASGGPAPIRPVAPPTITTPEVRYHTVGDGDSLSRISLRYYGTANRWQEIYQANRDVLQGSSALRVGQQLRIP